jgi:hypothetical protein
MSQANSERFQSFNRFGSETVSRRKLMPRSSKRSRSSTTRSNDWGVAEIVREKPIAAAAAAAGAAAAGLFLWSKRAQISNQLSSLSDQVGEWSSQRQSGDDTAGLTTTSSRVRGMSETGGGNASLGRRSGGGGVRSTASGRGRARSTAATQQ